MGFGGVQKAQASSFQAQDSLTGFQSQLNLQGANLQKGAADQEQQSLRDQADIAFSQAQQAAQQKGHEINQAVGNQAEGYAAGGVNLTGTPLAVMNETRMLGEQEINAITSRGSAQARLLRLQADQAGESGLADVLSAEGQNTVSQQQNKISQGQQAMQLQAQKQAYYRSLIGGGVGFGGQLLLAGLKA